MRITFDGEHRCGKGSQIDINLSTIPGALAVRGDGSYQGGLEEVLDPEQLALRIDINNLLYGDNGDSVRLWGIAARNCAEVLTLPELDDVDLLIDRGPISRAAYLISLGLEGRELRANMYPEYRYSFKRKIIELGALAVEDIDFGNIVYINVPAEELLRRVKDKDPKCNFRRNNIRQRAGLFERAIETLPYSIKDSIVDVDGDMEATLVYEQYEHILTE